MLISRSHCNKILHPEAHSAHCSFAYSALASFKTGMSGSVSFQRAAQVLIGGASRHSAVQKGFAGGFLLAHVIEHPDTAGKVLHR